MTLAPAKDQESTYLKANKALNNLSDYVISEDKIDIDNLPTIVLREEVDMKAFKKVIDNLPEIMEEKLARTMFNFKTGTRMTMEGTISLVEKMYKEKLKSSSVSYTYAHNKKYGRMYGRHSLQGLMRELRHTIARGIYKDFDIKNCHPCIAVQLCDLNNIPCPLFKHYCDNRDEYIAGYMKTLKKDRDSVKSLFLSILNGGNTIKELDRNIPTPQGLIDMTKEIENIHLSFEKIYPKIFKMSKNTFNRLGKGFNKVLCKYENYILHSVMNFCNQNGKQIGTNCFDGLLIYKSSLENDDSEVFCQALGQHVYNQTGFELKFLEKPMDEGLDLSNFSSKEDNEEKTIQAIRNKPSNTISYNSDYQWCDFIKQFLKTFDSWDELLENFVEFFPQVYTQIEKGTGFCLKKDGNDARDLFTLCPSVKFMCSYKNTQGKVDTISTIVLLRKAVSLDLLPLYSKLVYKPRDYDIRRYEFNSWIEFEGKKKSYPENKIILTEILDYIRVVISNNDMEVYKYIISWIRNIILTPWNKTKVAIFLQSKQGCGKGIFVWFLINCVFGLHCSTAVNGLTPLTQKHNKILMNKIFINVDELKCNSQKDFHGMFDTMKGLITEPRITVEPKGLESFDIENHCNYILTTNNMFSVKIEKNDRRYLCLRINEEKMGDYEFFRHIAEDVFTPEGGSLFYNYLSELDDSECCRLNPIPQTALKSEMADLSLSSVDLFFRNLETGDYEIPLRNYISEFTHKKTLVKFGMTPNDLYVEYNNFCIQNGESPCKGRLFWSSVKDIKTGGGDCLTRYQKKKGTTTFNYYNLSDLKKK